MARKITKADLKKIEAGTMLFDTITGKWVEVTRVNPKGYFEVEFILLETVGSLRRDYRI